MVDEVVFFVFHAHHNFIHQLCLPATAGFLNSREIAQSLYRWSVVKQVSGKMTIICGACGGRDSKISLGYIPRGNDMFTTFRQCEICETIFTHNIIVEPNFGLAGENLSNVEPFCSISFDDIPILSFKTPPVEE